MDLSRLNEPQRQAVLHGKEPLLVLAGAGTGKTAVISHRIAHMVRVLKVPPTQILAVTFTNKAAREMRERTAKLSDLSPNQLDIGTFHRICGNLLRRHGTVLGLQPAFVIYDGDDQLQLLRRLVVEMQLDPQQCTPRSLRSQMEAWKNQGLLPEQVEVDPHNVLQRRARDVYARYRARCLADNAVDFSDMLLHCVTLLQQHPAILAGIRARWTHLLVDEYQDTNAVQYMWLKLLVTDAHSLTVVGDDDQSIYRWRGADIHNILRFESDFPGATVIRLEQNYRCTQSILHAANSVIAHNQHRKGKTLFALDRPGQQLVLRVYDSERDEGNGVAAAIEAALMSSTQPSDVAILYRTNAQSRPLEDALRRRRIPYVIYGGVRFYDRREVKDALAYLRLLINPRSSIDFLRVVNQPPRGLGKTSLDALTDAAAQAGQSLCEVARSVAPRLRGKARAALVGFVDMLAGWQQELDQGEALGRVLEHVLADSGLWAQLQQENTPEATDRLDNLKELVAALDEYAAEAETPTLEGFLEDVSLATDIDDLGLAGGQVAMMTLHAAKGLEFGLVLLPGMEEGLFPHSRAAEDQAALEEERRLCYVGLTRAKQQVLLSAARSRTIFGVPQISRLSRFLAEIPRDLLDLGAAAAALDARADGEAAVDDADAHLIDPPAPDESSQLPPNERPAAAAPQPTSASVGAFVAGARVRHSLFGEGAVLKAEAAGARQMVTVQFPQPVGRKVIVARFIELVG